MVYGLLLIFTSKQTFRHWGLDETAAREEGNRRAKHKRLQTSLNLALGGKVVGAGHRLDDSVGG